METYPQILKTNSKKQPMMAVQDFRAVSSNDLEYSFAGKLAEVFKTKLFVNYRVGYYYPDIAFIDELNSIYIDIEIDEPYSQSGNPTHFKEDYGEKKRDSFFTENGWNVLRFSENQVMNHPKKVIKTIEIFYNTLINNNIDQELEDIIRIYIEPRWTRDEALEYLKNYRRDYYEFDHIKIEENRLKIINEFCKIEEIFKVIIEKHITDFNRDNDIILLPYLISDIYFNVLEKSKLVFLYLFPSDVGLSLSLTDTIYCRFSSPLKIEIKDTDDIITFNAIVEKKIKNSRINVDDNFFRKFQFYDFFWYGCYENYQNSEKEFFKEIRMI